MTMIGSSMFGRLLNYFLTTPKHPYLQIIPGRVRIEHHRGGVAVSSFDEGRRGGLVLQLSGFQAKLAEQPPEVLQRMFMLSLVLPIIIWSVAMVVTRLYPLTRQSAIEIRAELETRRGRI